MVRQRLFGKNSPACEGEIIKISRACRNRWGFGLVDFSAKGRIRPAYCGGRNWLLTSGEVNILKILMKGLKLPFGN